MRRLLTQIRFIRFTSSRFSLCAFVRLLSRRTRSMAAVRGVCDSDSRPWHQSPIDISTTTAVYDPALKGTRFQFDYHTEDLRRLRKDSDGWVIWVEDGARSGMSASHLNGKYKLHEVRFHSRDVKGSQHTINGEGLDGEIQLIHWNIEYDSFEEALAHSDGVAALAIFLRESESTNPILENLIGQISEAVCQNGAYNLDQGFDLDGFLSSALSAGISEFWTYHGSLATKPFYECAVWTVFRGAARVSKRQLEAFRDLRQDLSSENFEKKADPMNISSPESIHRTSHRFVSASFHGGGRGSFRWDDSLNS